MYHQKFLPVKSLRWICPIICPLKYNLTTVYYDNVFIKLYGNMISAYHNLKPIPVKSYSTKTFPFFQPKYYYTSNSNDFNTTR